MGEIGNKQFMIKSVHEIIIIWSLEIYFLLSKSKGFYMLPGQN